MRSTARRLFHLRSSHFRGVSFLSPRGVGRLPFPYREAFFTCSIVTSVVVCVTLLLSYDFSHAQRRHQQVRSWPSRTEERRRHRLEKLHESLLKDQEALRRLSEDEREGPLVIPSESEQIPRLTMTETMMRMTAHELNVTIYEHCQRLIPGDAEVGGVQSSSAVRPLELCLVENALLARRYKVGHNCNKLEESLRTPGNFSTMRLFVLRYRRLFWCPVFKAASTNWMLTLPELSHFNLADLEVLRSRYSQPNNVARFVYKPVNASQFKTFVDTDPEPIGFVIVRHPLRRLLSAYRDKLEVMNEHFHKLYGQSIVEKYRERGRIRFGDEFYQGLHKGAPIPVPERNGSTPTFWEFVKAVLEERLLDEHWRPIHDCCNPCNIHYRYILRFESLAAEQAHFVRVTGLPQKSLLELRLNANKRVMGSKEEKKYFGMLNDQEMRSLCYLFRTDLILFEYDVTVEDFGRSAKGCAGVLKAAS